MARIPKKTVAVAAVLLGGALGFLIWAQSHTSEIPPASEYAPNFWFDKDEQYFPTDPLKFFYDENLNELPGEEAKAKYDKLSKEEKLKNFTVFYKIDDAGPEIVYQYWLFYVFNYGFNEHYGDWESVFVFVDKNTKEITRTIGSFHQRGLENIEVSGKNLAGVRHIWNYVAEGGHPNCPDYESDGFCDVLNFKLERARSATDFTAGGPRILYDGYPLLAIDDLHNRLQKEDLITKSEILGMFPITVDTELPVVGVLNYQVYALPFGGNPPEDPWAQAEYRNPYAARPLSVELAAEWGRNVVGKASAAVRSVFNSLQSFAAQINPFNNRGFARVSNITGGVSTGEPSVASTPFSVFDEGEFSGVPSPISSNSLDDLQNQLDDAAEQVDLLWVQIKAFQDRQVTTPVTSTATTTFGAQIPIPSRRNSVADAESQQPESKLELALHPELHENTSTLCSNTLDDDGDTVVDLADPDCAEFTPSEEPQAEESQEPEDITPKTVVINEIAWMGTRANTADEWIELHNTTKELIDLAGWRLVAQDGIPDITFATSDQTIIPAGGFYLLERTDDTTVSDIAADKVYKGALENSPNCEILSLYDASGVLIDETACNGDGSWPAGDNETKQTMERIDPARRGSDPSNWANNNLWTRNGKDADNNSINGTPKTKNSVSFLKTEITNIQLAALFEEFDELHFSKLGSPYIITPISMPPLFRSTVIPAGKTLIVNPGVQIQFNYEDQRLLETALRVEGTLLAAGTETDPVLFTSAVQDRFWCGIFFTETSFGSEIAYAIIQKARCNFPVEPEGVASEWVIASDRAPISIRNTMFQGDASGLGSGVYLRNASPHTIVENSSVAGYDIGLFIEGGGPLVRGNIIEENSVGIQVAAGSPTIDGNTFIRNGTPARAYAGASPIFSNSTVQEGRRVVEIYPEAGIAIPEGTETRWSSDIPYLIVGRISVAGKLSVAPGMIIKFRWGGLEIFGGEMEAFGTPEQPIIFTSFQDDAYGGDADGGDAVPGKGMFVIDLNNSTASFEFENIVVRYGGDAGSWLGSVPSRSAITLENGNLSLTNAVFEFNLKAGLEIGSANSQVTVNNATFISNDTGLIVFQVGELNISNSTFLDNQIHIHFYWSDSGGLCEVIGGEGDTNTYSPPVSEDTIRCEEGIP